MRLPCGHVDFYPNGGKKQPGCPGLSSIIKDLYSNVYEISCNHKRAVEFFSESINSPCKHLAYPCYSFVS